MSKKSITIGVIIFFLFVTTMLIVPRTRSILFRAASIPVDADAEVLYNPGTSAEGDGFYINNGATDEEFQEALGEEAFEDYQQGISPDEALDEKCKLDPDDEDCPKLTKKEDVKQSTICPYDSVTVNLTNGQSFCKVRGEQCGGLNACDGEGPLSCQSGVCAYCKADADEIAFWGAVPSTVKCGGVGLSGSPLEYQSEASYVLAWQMGILPAQLDAIYDKEYDEYKDYNKYVQETYPYGEFTLEIIDQTKQAYAEVFDDPLAFTGPYANPNGVLSKDGSVIRWLHTGDGSSAFVVRRTGQVSYQTASAFLMDIVPVQVCNNSGKCNAVEFTIGENGSIENVLVGETLTYNASYCTVPSDAVYGPGINAEQALHNMYVSGCGGAPTAAAPTTTSPEQQEVSTAPTSQPYTPQYTSYPAGTTSSYPSQTNSTSSTAPSGATYPISTEEWKTLYEDRYSSFLQRIKGIETSSASSNMVVYTDLNDFSDPVDWDWSCKIGDFNSDCLLDIIDLYAFALRVCKPTTIGSCYQQADIDKFIKLYNQ